MSAEQSLRYRAVAHYVFTMMFKLATISFKAHYSQICSLCVSLKLRIVHLLFSESMISVIPHESLPGIQPFFLSPPPTFSVTIMPYLSMVLVYSWHSINAYWNPVIILTLPDLCLFIKLSLLQPHPKPDMMFLTLILLLHPFCTLYNDIDSVLFLCNIFWWFVNHCSKFGHILAHIRVEQNGRFHWNCW